MFRVTADPGTSVQVVPSGDVYALYCVDFVLGSVKRETLRKTGAAVPLICTGCAVYAASWVRYWTTTPLEGVTKTP